MDIALDNMTGMQFVKVLRQYGSIKNVDVGGVWVAPANPEQSKHLETASAILFGLRVDFVNLRSEYYDTSSRIPKTVGDDRNFDL